MLVEWRAELLVDGGGLRGGCGRVCGRSRERVLAFERVAVTAGVRGRGVWIGSGGARGVGAWCVGRGVAGACGRARRAGGLVEEGGGGEAALDGVGGVAEDLEEDVGGEVVAGAGLEVVVVVEPGGDVGPREEGEEGEEVGGELWRVLGLVCVWIRGGDEGVFVVEEEAGEEGRVGWIEGWKG